MSGFESLPYSLLTPIPAIYGFSANPIVRHTICRHAAPGASKEGFEKSDEPSRAITSVRYD